MTGVRVGFVGAGAIAQAHYDAFVRAGAQVVAVTTRGETGELFTQRNPEVRYYLTLPQMLENAGLDAVCVLTHPSAYPQIVKAVAERHLPLLLEKPVALSSREANILKRELPPTTMVALNRRFYSTLRPIREILGAHTELLAQLVVPERERDYHALNAQDKNHWHIFNSIHPFDLFFSLVGYPSTGLTKSTWGVLPESSLPRYLAAQYRSDRGHQAVVMSNYDSPGGWRIHVFGPKVEVILSPLEKAVVKTLQGVQEIALASDDVDFKAGFVAQARCFLEGVKNPRSLPAEWVSFDDAVRSIVEVEKLFSTGS